MKLKKIPVKESTAQTKKDKNAVFKTYISKKGNQVKRRDRYGYGSGIYTGVYGKY